MNKLGILAVVLSIAFFVFTLGATWWWAIVGMSPDVASAWIITCSFFGLGAFVSWMGADIV